MLQRKFGTTGWTVSAVGCGTWGLGGQWGPVEPAVAEATLRAAHDAGVTFFDTADVYGLVPGVAECLLGSALGPVRDRVLLATKVGHLSEQFGERFDFSKPAQVERCCEASLQRLGVDVIDLYQCHLASTGRPEVFGEAFERLVQQGKIRACGVSTNLLRTVQAFAAGGKLASVQLGYNITSREAERELLPYCQAHGLAVIVRSPLAKGLLAGKFSASTRFDDQVRRKWNEGTQRREFLEQVASVGHLRWLERRGRTLAQAAIQFVLSHPAVSVAIPGAKTPQQARDNAAAGAAVLAPGELARIRIGGTAFRAVRILRTGVRRAVRGLLPPRP